MAGDRVTAHAFRRLKHEAARRLDDTVPPAAAGTIAADLAENVRPTRFEGSFGRDFALRFGNFWTLWQVAERLKEQAAEGELWECVKGLCPADGRLTQPV
jgi:hypothetical protein